MKIILERKKCIGCGSCVALCSKYWELADDGLARIKGGKINSQSGNDELEVKSSECNQEAADACPVQIIKISH